MDRLEKITYWSYWSTFRRKE